jgi:catechol 2,3-dioxygenase-like lactoylglutathione lyase family enzyme
MKRLHVHINVPAERFAETETFYRHMLGAEASKTKPGYSKWLIDAPAINLVIEATEAEASVGVHHLGLQVDETEELAAIERRTQAAGLPFLKIGETACCYAASEKSWTADPVGVRWELFRSFADVETYGEKTAAEKVHYTG